MIMASPEYKALIECSSDVALLLQHEYLSTANKLLQRALITDQVYGWVLSAHGVSHHDKATRMVSCVTDKVKHSPEAFHIFLGVLRENSFFRDVADRLSGRHSTKD